MKRGIKFRGKSKNTGDWLYGVPVKSVNDNMYLIHSATEDAINTFNDVDFVYSEVIPETVGQFTGLKDINGVEIYEGDILKIDEGHPVEVRYEKIYASFGIWRKGWAFLHYFHEAVEPKDCEVIGNIHDKIK